jgi:branched-chain amino acid transport system ATP-binding protein
VLDVRDLWAGYNGLNVLHGLSLSLDRGQTVVLVGANGAGKSTFLKVLAGVVPAHQASISVDGKTASRWSSRASVDARIVLVPEGRHVFGSLSVQDNLRLGAWVYRRDHRTVRHRLEMVLELFPALATRLNVYAGLLSGGQQQMLAIGRGLMAAPCYLLLDEPSAGLAPRVCDEIFAAIGQLAATDVAVLMAEQNARAALKLADEGHLVERGRITLSGTGRDLLMHPEITDRVLGATDKCEVETGLRESVRLALGGSTVDVDAKRGMGVN